MTRQADDHPKPGGPKASVEKNPKGFWTEYWEVGRILVLDALYIITGLVGLMLVFAVIQILEATRYDRGHIHTFLEIHFWTFTGVMFVFAVDVVFKLVTLLLRGHRK